MQEENKVQVNNLQTEIIENQNKQEDFNVENTPQQELQTENNVQESNDAPILENLQEEPNNEKSQVVEIVKKSVANNLQTKTASVKKAERLTITISFPADEAAHINKIIEERMKAGVTNNLSHFIRQCVDFTMNYNFVFNDKKFGLPDDCKKFLLKDAYFNNTKK